MDTKELKVYTPPTVVIKYLSFADIVTGSNEEVLADNPQGTSTWQGLDLQDEGATP